MLPADARLRSRDDFATALRRGRRVTHGPLVFHLATEPNVRSVGPCRVGFVISGKVASAVRRNTLRRRLREVLRARLDRLPAGGTLVVRALPGAADLDSPGLARLVDAALLDPSAR